MEAWFAFGLVGDFLLRDFVLVLKPEIRLGESLVALLHAQQKGMGH